MQQRWASCDFDPLAVGLQLEVPVKVTSVGGRFAALVVSSLGPQLLVRCHPLSHHSPQVDLWPRECSRSILYHLSPDPVL